MTNYSFKPTAMVKPGVLVTDFGTIEIPASALLALTMRLGAATAKVPTLQRLFFGQPANPARDLVDRYFLHVNDMMELGYKTGEPSWKVHIISFDEWIKAQ